jgi:hypothetical protein
MKLAAKRRLLEAVAGRGGDDEDRRAEVELVLRLRRQVARVDLQDLLRTLAGLLDAAARQWPELERAIVAWVDLVEQLVHDAEWRYPGPGLGAMKKAEVREAFRYLVRSGRLQLPMPPGVPLVLRPLVGDVAVSWVIDAIVALLNDHDAWEPPPRPRTARERAVVLRHRVLRAAASSPPAALLVRLATWAWEAASAGPPLSPEVRRALAAVEEHGMLERANDVVAGVARLAVEVGENPRAFVAGVRLVGIVVETAERFTWLDGPGKRRAATRLVTIVLQDSGLAPRSPAATVLLEAATGIAIDSVVRVFNKRGVFGG